LHTQYIERIKGFEGKIEKKETFRSWLSGENIYQEKGIRKGGITLPSTVFRGEKRIDRVLTSEVW